MRQPTTENSPRARRRAAAISRILDVALHIITEQGFAACTLKRVADAADYTPAALYRYFPDKDALIGALTVQLIEALAAQVAASTARFEAPITQLLAGLGVYRRFAHEQPHAFAMLTLMMAHPTSLFTRLEQAEEAMVAMATALGPIHDALTEATESGLLEPGPVAERAVALFAATQGALQLHKQASLAPELVPMERVAARIGVDLLRGWGCDSSLLDEALGEVGG
ncbi:MAG: TetR/AcrR family transcriptional regulator [Bradymonadia bacterium]